MKKLWPSRARLLFGFGSALTIFQQTADAQEQEQALPPEVLQAFDAPALRYDALSLALNPAGLGFLAGYHGVLSYQSTAVNRETKDDTSALSTYHAWGWKRRVAAGLGGEWLNSPEKSGLVRFGLAVAMGDVSIGVSTRNYFSDSSRSLDHFMTTDAGLIWRFSRFASYSFAVKNLATSRLDGAVTPRSFEMDLGFRDSRAIVRADIGITARQSDIENGAIRANVILRPVGGFNLFGGAEYSLLTDSLSYAVGGIQFDFGAASASTAARSTDGDVQLIATAEFGSDLGRVSWPAQNTWVRLDLGGDLPEVSDPEFLRSPRATFTDLLANLHQIAGDNSVNGIYVVVSGLDCGSGKLWELRDAVARVQSSGKKVIMYLPNPNVRDLYLAASADFVVAPQTANVLNTGLSASRIYFGDLLQNAGIEAQFVRIGDYKSGPERFTGNGPSAPASEQLNAVFDDIWADYETVFRTAADLTDAQWAEFSENPPLSAQDMVDLGLVDKLAYPDEMPKVLEDAGFESPRILSISQYNEPRVPNWQPNPAVAVLHIDGAIVDAPGGILGLGGGTDTQSVQAACQQLRNNDHVRAVIVRIDSPGGSALASDGILREIARLAEKKSVFVSMGNVAGSGGYYVASVGKPIFATPNTVTGSIGIYAGTFALDELFEWVGIHRETISRGGDSIEFNGSAWTEADRAVVLESLTSSYNIFLQHVATSRGKTADEIDEVAQGRVWSGVDAKGVDLVDDLTGFLGALAAAKEEMGLAEHAKIRLDHYPKQQWTLRDAVEIPSLVQVLIDQTGARAWVQAALSVDAGTPMAMLEDIIVP